MQPELLTHVTFTSAAFPMYDDDREDEVNPGLFGRRLAEFLHEGLPRHGAETGLPFPEDWGWVVPVKNRGFRIWIGCGAYAGRNDRFLCFIEPHQQRIRRFPFLWTTDTTAALTRLQYAIDQLLQSHAGVQDICWETHADFMRPRYKGRSSDWPRPVNQ